METLVTEYCDACADYVILNQDQANCANEHNCELIPPNCPLISLFISKSITSTSSKEKDNNTPKFYLSDT